MPDFSASVSREIFFWDETSLFLNTGMTERDFSRSGFARLLENPGLVAVPKGSPGKPEGGFSLHDWRFTETKLTEAGSLRLCAPLKAPLLGQAVSSGAGSGGKTFYECVTGTDLTPEFRWNAVLTVASAMDAAVSVGKAEMVAPCGPLGIIVRDDGSVLFLPVPLFPRLVSSWGDDFSHDFLDIWTNLSEGMGAGVVYTLSVCLYRMLAGFFPRNEASNGYSGVVPLGVAAHNIDGAIAALIDRGLRIHQRGETIPSLAEIRAALPDSRDGCFTGSQSESLWQKRFAAYTEKLRKKTVFRHFMRKQRTVLIGAAVAVAVIAGVGFSLAKDFGDRPTTAGLEPQEVVERFYQAVTEMDQGNVDACVTKGAGKVYISPMSSLYVVSKMREYYESQKTVLTPVEWFTEKMPEGISVFGVMDLTVTEIAVPSETASTRRASSADESAYLATFYFFNPGAPEESLPVITRHEDTLLLSRSKTGWRIYSLVQNRVSELSVEETEGLVGASLLGL